MTIQSKSKTCTTLVFATLAGLVLGGCLSNEKQSAGTNSGNNPDPSGNNAPTISGNPDRAVLMGDTYNFQPSANDADGDPLTFSINNRPGWASFDASNGRLSGTPDLGDIGDYNNIRISVSDGTDSAALPAFGVTVSQTALGSVTLSWNPPTQNTDGTALQDLAGYRIYYGQSSRDYDNVIQIDNEGVTTYVVDNLVPDTYFFAATALNDSGMESSYSSEAIRTVN